MFIFFLPVICILLGCTIYPDRWCSKQRTRESLGIRSWSNAGSVLWI